MGAIAISNTENKTIKKSLTEIIKNSQKYLNISEESFGDAYQVLFKKPLDDTELEKDIYVLFNKDNLEPNHSLKSAGFYFKKENKGVIISAMDAKFESELKGCINHNDYNTAFKNGKVIIRRSQDFEITKQNPLENFIKIFQKESSMTLQKYNDNLNRYYFE